MATTGIKHPVFAPITARNTGAKPTYGTGILVAKATKADITINTAEGKLYADDSLAEYDSKFQSGTLQPVLTNSHQTRRRLYSDIHLTHQAARPFLRRALLMCTSRRLRPITRQRRSTA